MDASWLALPVAAIAAIPGTLAWLGARADRRARQREQLVDRDDRRRDAVVDGYDRLVDDLQAELARLQRQVEEQRTELERRGRRPRPGPRGGERR